MKMDEGPGKLNEALIESVFRPLAFREPKFLQHIVSFVEELSIKAFKIPQVMGVQGLPLAALDQGCDLSTFVTHRSRLGHAAWLSKSREILRAWTAARLLSRRGCIHILP